jgi:dTDP-4-dehydrorhamnose reductase
MLKGNTQMKQLLVTGASGFLGWNICNAAHTAGWQVAGTVHENAITVSGVTAHSVDLTDRTAIDALFEKVRPDAVIHAAALADPNACQKYPDKSRLMNIDIPVYIAQLCAEYECPCVFTSTDLVFDGTHAPYSEDAPTCPVSVYGEHKAEAERGMLEINPHTLVCRMPLMFGDAPLHAKSFIQPLMNAMLKGQTCTLFTDEFRSPVSGADAARGILRMIDCAEGILHLGGRQRMSRFDFGVVLAHAMGIDAPVLTPCRQQDIAMAAQRPPDVSLNSTKAFMLGYEPDTVVDALAQLTCIRTLHARPV